MKVSFLKMLVKRKIKNSSPINGLDVATGDAEADDDKPVKSEITLALKVLLTTLSVAEGLNSGPDKLAWGYKAGVVTKKELSKLMNVLLVFVDGCIELVARGAAVLMLYVTVAIVCVDTTLVDIFLVESE